MSTICSQRHPLNCGQPKKLFWGRKCDSHCEPHQLCHGNTNTNTTTYRPCLQKNQSGDSDWQFFFILFLRLDKQDATEVVFLVDLPIYRFSLKNDNTERCGAAYQSKPMVTQQVLVSASETTEVGNCATFSWLLARVWVGCPQCRAPMDGLACPVSGSLLRTLSTPFFSQ